MRKLFVEDVLKSPGKLLALCFIVYLAATSFFVGIFLCFVAVHWFRKQIMLKAKALEASDAEAARERANEARDQALKTSAANAAAHASPAPAAVAQTPPPRQYARSAVVIPMKKTGTDN